MHHLTLFAGASVEGPTGPLSGRPVQRRRLALLAILATGQARGRGVGRDKLVAYLWPEADPERGRPLLSDSVYRINQAVDGEAIVPTGDELRLNAEVISSDVADFERAVQSGDRERAIGLYGGPLLDGVHLIDGSEFERWLDGERSRLARAFEELLDEMAQAADASGAHADAVIWWRRLAVHDPFSSRVALRLMQALAAVGDSAAAVRHAVIHSTLLREELGVEPNAAVLRLCDRLKAAPAEPALSVSAPREAAAARRGLAPAAPPCAKPAVAPHRLASDSRRRRVPGKKGFALSLGQPRALPTACDASIAVLPFLDLSPERDNAYFSDGITEELINMLAHVPGAHVAARTSVFAYRDKHADVRAVGRRLGVAMVLEGSVRKSGDKVRIAVQLANTADGFQVWSESYDRQLTDVFAIQEDLSRAIVDALRKYLIPAGTVRMAERSTHDAEAYGLYLK